MQASESTQHQELRAYLALNRWPNASPQRLLTIKRRFDKLSTFLEYPKELLSQKQWQSSLGRYCLAPDWAGVDRDIAWAMSEDCHILTLDDPLYPNRLKMLNDPPLLLYAKGQLETLSHKMLAIVGAREPSLAGMSIAEELSSGLAQNWTLISGLARGIDRIAHQSALFRECASVAVLGSGLQNIYPPEHHNLARLMAEIGLLLSEFPLDAAPKPWHFPQRNRLISGLSYGVIVIEAGLKSGSMLTARLARAQGRPLFVVPGSVLLPQMQGSHQLIRDGAELVTKLEHVEQALAARSKKEYAFSPSSHDASMSY